MFLEEFGGVLQENNSSVIFVNKMTAPASYYSMAQGSLWFCFGDKVLGRILGYVAGNLWFLFQVQHFQGKFTDEPGADGKNKAEQLILEADRIMCTQMFSVCRAPDLKSGCHG